MARRKRVYIAGPISKGDLKLNVDRATRAYLALATWGFAPLCPHWSVYAKETFREFGEVYCKATAAGNPQMNHQDWLDIDLPWIAASDIVLRIPGESVGADMEVEEAQRLGIPVYWTLSQLLAKEETTV